MKQVNIVINNGHRNAANGATGTTGEVDLIDKVFGALSPLLIKAGLQVYYDDANLTNTKSLGDNLMYFVAPHFDGSTNPSYNGGFIDDCPACPNGGVTPCDNSSVQSWKFAQTVADNYFIPMGIAFAPHSTNDSKYYYAFNYTGANTKQFIIELGTLTNQSDHDKCQDYGKIATLLTKGIVSYLTQFDTTYQAYLQGQPAPTPSPSPVNYQAQIDSLTTQLAQQKKSLADLQQTTVTQLAAKDADCLSKLQALKDKIKTFVSSA